MLNWTSFIVATVISSSLLAQYQLDIPVKGKLVLKDTHSKDLEIKDDTKLEVHILEPATLANLVLKKEYQVKLTSGAQEVIFNVVQGRSTKAEDTHVYLNGDKKTNNQDVHIQCTSETRVRDEGSLTLEKGYVACIKTNACKSYVLGSDKKFKQLDTGVCTGKKEVLISKENALFNEVITCRLFDESDENKSKISTKFTFTKALTDLQEKYVRQSASDECR